MADNSVPFATLILVRVAIDIIFLSGATCPLIVSVLLLTIPDPSFAVAFTVTVPFVRAMSRPLALIDADPDSFTTDQVTALLLALLGKTKAFI